MEIQSKKIRFSISRKIAKNEVTNRGIASSLSSKLRPMLTSDSRSKYRAKVDSSPFLKSRAHSSTFSSLPATCWCLYDAKTSTQLGFRHTYKREVASLTKIMTTIVGLELKERFGLSQNVMIRVSESAFKCIGTTASLKPFHWIMLKDLFYGIMLPSGNDAAHLLAQVMGYLINITRQGEQASFQTIKQIDLTQQNTPLLLAQFVRVMNAKAEELELTQTRFSNPHGLQNAMNTSTAKNILSLSLYATGNKKFRKIMNTDMHMCYSYTPEKDRKEVKKWVNTNLLLKNGWQGVKTGQTIAAGNCLASVKDNIYIVVLNCPDSLKRFTQTQRLYEWYIERRKIINSTLTTEADSFQS